MAIGFEYTLGVDENASLTSLKEFAKIVEGTEMKLKLDFDLGTISDAIDKVRQQINELDSNIKLSIGSFDINTNGLQEQLNSKAKNLKLILKVEFDDMSLKEQQANPGEKIRKNFEQELELMKDSMHRMLNSLKAQMDKANIGSDIIDVKAVKQSIDELNLTESSFAEIKQRAKEIKNDIQAWQQAIKINNSMLTNTGKLTDEVRTKMRQVAEESDASKIRESMTMYQRRLEIQKQSVTMSRQFKEATQDVKNALTQEMDAMEITGNSVKELAKNYQEASVRIREMKGDLKASHIEEHGYAFNNLSESVKGLVKQYIGFNEVVQATKAVLKDSYDYVKSLDDAYTDVAISMDISREEFNGWVGTANEIARANGVTTTSVMDMVKIYAQAGEDISAVQDKLAGTAAIQNITQWDADKATSVVNSVVNQFNLLEDSVTGASRTSSEAIEYFGDRLIYLSNQLSIDNVKAIQEMSNAIDDSGSVIYNAGGSMEWFMAIAGKLAETTNMTGNEIGAAMRMITARTLRQGEAVEALGESADDLDFKMAKAEKTLGEVGVSIRGETSDELLSIEEILNRVAGAWDKLSDSQKQAIGEAMAGTNRSSAFQAIMNNYESIAQLAQEANQADGELMEANQKRVESLDGKLNQLRTTVEKAYNSFLNSEAVIGAIEGIDNALQWMMEHSETVVAIVIALGGAWMGIKWGSIVNSLGGVIEQIILMGTESAVATGAVAALKGGLIALGGAAVIGAIVLVCKKIQEIIPNADRAREALNNLTENYNNYEEAKTSSKTVAEDVQAYFDAQDALKTLTEGTEEYNNMLQTSNEKLAAIGESYPDIKGILENENMSLENKKLKIDQILSALEQEYQLNMLNSLASDKDLEAMNKRIADNIELLNQYEEAVKRYNDGGNEVQVIGNSEFNMADPKTAEFFENIRKDIAGTVADVETFNGTIQKLQEDGLALERQTVEISEEALAIKDAQVKKQEELTRAKQETANAEGPTSEEEKIAAQERLAQLEAERAANAKLLNEEYAKAVSQIEEAHVLLGQVNTDFENMDLTKLVNSDVMEGFTGSINNAVEVVDYLKGKLQELEDTAYEKSINMALNNNDTWNEIVNTAAKALGIQEKDMARFVNNLSGIRNVDIRNATSAANAELQMNVDVINQLLTAYAGISNQKAGYRKVDMSNIIAFLNEQGRKEGMTVNQLNGLWASFYSAKKKAIKSELKDLNKQANAMRGFAGDPTVRINMNKLNNELSTLESANRLVGNYFSGVNSTFKKISSGLSQSIASTNRAITHAVSNASNILKKKYDSANKKSSSNKSNKKEVADLDLNIDKFTQLEEAINRVEEALQRNAEAQAAITKKADLRKLLDQEIQLMEKKKNALEDLKRAQIQEQQSLKSYLQRAGLRFNGDELVGDNVTGGTVSDRLKNAQDWANRATGAEKERRIADTKYLQEQIETYYDLMNAIGSTQGQINDLTLEMHKNKIENEVLMRTVQDLGDRYIKVTMQMGKLDSELSLNQREQELATGQVLLNLREKELRLLQDKKRVNQQNINELKKEQKELRDVIASTGFGFNPDGSISNYDAIWTGKMNEYNSLAGYKKEEYEGYMRDLAGFIERYVEILNTELPKAEENFYDILEAEKQLAKQQEEYNKQLEELKNNYDYLFQISQKLTQAERELTLLDEKMQNATYEEKIAMLERQEEIYKSQLKLMEEQKRVQEQLLKEKQNDLSGAGFKFDEQGFVRNYEDVVGSMFKQIQNMEGGAIRDALIEDYEDLIAKVEDYNDALGDVSETEKSWWQLNNSVKDAQEEQLQLIQEIQESIKDAITNKWQETTDNLQNELNKQKELLNKQWEEEDWEDTLTDAQDELNKIQAQINNLSKDTSLAGQLKLEQLKEEYQKQLEAMNEMIKDHEREMTNQVFEDESQRLEDQMQEALKTEQLMQSVTNALASGYTTIGEQAIKLNDLLKDQIQEAKDLWGDVISLGLNLTTSGKIDVGALEKARTSTVTTNAPLITIDFNGNLDGSITKADVERITQQATDDIMVKLYDLMK